MAFSKSVTAIALRILSLVIVVYHSFALVTSMTDLIPLGQNYLLRECREEPAARFVE